MRQWPMTFQAGRRSRRAGGFALMLALVLAAPAFAASFSAALDRDTITLGENATLTLTFEGGQPSSISQPSVPNLQIADRGSSQNISFVNGQMSATIAQTFEVTARQPGEYTIPAISVQMSGQTLASQPLKLTVLKPGQPSADAIQSGSQLAFMKLKDAPAQVYFGQSFAAQVDVYVRDGVPNAGGFQFTSLPSDGVTSGKWMQGEIRRERIGNVGYRVVPLIIACTAIKTGTFSLGPITATIIVEVPAANRRNIDPMPDPFGMFRRVEQKQITLATEDRKIESLPLPADRVPPGFNGAVGNYTMAATAGPTTLAVGDPITVRVQISGRGALDALALGDQGWQNFKTYPATTKPADTDPLGLQGTKTFEQIVVPESSELKALPPISFSFFDPEQKSYRTLTQPAIPLVVKPGGQSSVPTIAAGARPAEDNPPASSDIVPIKQHLGAVAQVVPPLARQPWFVALQGVPALAFVGAIAWRKRREALANNPRLRRQRHVAQLVRAGLEDLRKFAAQNQPVEFFATLFHLLQEQLGERLDVPASSITEAVIDERLRPRGVPEPALAALHELFQTCNLARYAPDQDSRELAAMVPRVEAVLRELQGLKA